MDKPTKPTNLIPRSFGGVKNNFSTSLQSSGYEDGVPAIYGGDNLNYQLDATGKELDYCEKICDYINAIPINKTPIVDANNKLVYTQYDIRVYNANETYYKEDFVTGYIDNKKYIFKSVQDNNVGHALSDVNYWVKTDISHGVLTIGRNIGEIVSSTVLLTDVGLHLLDGSLLSGSGSYSSFVDYIKDLYIATPTANYFCTEAQWQESVNTYGVCGKFVYNSTNNTVRLPKITGFIEGASGVASLGDLTEAGLPDHKHTFLLSDQETGAGTATQGSWITTNQDTSLASEYNPIYGNSSTVQPQSIKVLYYIVVATSTKTDVEVDIDQIASDLNGKADVDLENVTTGAFSNVLTTANASDKETIQGWLMPDYSNATTVSYSSGDAVGFDGWLAIDGSVSGLALTGWVAINGIKFCKNYRGNQDGGGATFAGITMVRATDVITMQYFNGTIYKIPFVGGNA